MAMAFSYGILKAVILSELMLVSILFFLESVIRESMISVGQE